LQKALILVIIIIMVSGCAAGRQTESGQDPPLSTVLEVTSEPSGAAVVVMVDNLDPKTREQTPYIKTDRKGVTPCQIEMEQGKTRRYFIEISKDGYRTEICKVTWDILVSHPDHKTGKTIEKIGDVLMSPALLILGGALQSSGPSRSLILSPNPLKVVLNPSTKQPASKNNKE
jgi:hypothetical protein